MTLAESIPATLERIPPERIANRFVERIPIHFAREHGLIGLTTDDPDLFLIASEDPTRWQLIDNLGLVLEAEVRAIGASAAEIQRAINWAYGQRRTDVDGLLSTIELVDDPESHAGEDDLLDDDERAPVIKLVNRVLFEAIKRRASDVHIQPAEDALMIRLRIDGILQNFLRPAASLTEELVSRIKVMAGMDIAEKRLAQDGRTTVRIGDRIIDLRVASLPTTHGERVVLRLLDQGARLYELPELGMPGDVQSAFEDLIRRSHGILLVTGPTGSGKTTTLYAALQRIDYARLNVVTLEDPVEYHFSGISQTQVSTRKGMTFATGLRSVLRQDPDVILVGEIRDEETARMAVQSSLTGHLVLSTLHTNDTASAVGRLLDLGVEPYLVADSLLGILAQRLIRLNCAACTIESQISMAAANKLGLSAEGSMVCQRGQGCPQCAGTGFRERQAIFELLLVNGPVQQLIHDRHSAAEIRRAARARGMRTLRDEAIRQMRAGRTTPEDVLRVTQVGEDG